MLALDRGGTTLGVAFRLARGEERAELLLVWRREMFTGAYHARWVILATDEGPVHALRWWSIESMTSTWQGLMRVRLSST